MLPNDDTLLWTTKKFTDDLDATEAPKNAWINSYVGFVTAVST